MTLRFLNDVAYDAESTQKSKHYVIGTRQGLMCLAQRHNAVTPEGLKPAIPRSPVKHSITEPLRSLYLHDG